MSELVKKITFREIREAAKSGYNATVIINGESYILDPSENDFIDGVMFAAASIEDRQARFNLSVPYKATKKAIKANQDRSTEAKSIVDFLRHIVLPGAGLDRRITEYNAGTLWKL